MTRPLDYSMRRAVNRASAVVLREAKRRALEELERVRAVCTHERARVLLCTHTQTVKLCPSCLRLIVHTETPR